MIANDIHATQTFRLKTPRIRAGVASGPFNASLVGTRFVLAAAAIAATAVNWRPGKSSAGATT